MGVGDAGLGAELARPGRLQKVGLAQGVGDHLYFPPADAAFSQAHPKRLGEGLLGGEAHGEGRGGPDLPRQ